MERSQSSSIAQSRNDRLSLTWSIIVLVGVFFLSVFFSRGASHVPTAQAATGPIYPGDDNWDKRFTLGGVDNPPLALAVDGSNLFMGGRFDFGGSTPLNNVGYWDGAAWRAMSGGIPGDLGDFANAIAIGGDNVYVGGKFSAVGSLTVAAQNIAMWSKTAHTWSALGGGLDRPVQGIVVIGTDVFVSGNFNSAGGIPTNFLARWDGTTWHALGDLTVTDSITSIATDGTNLYVLGSFTTIGGVPASGVAYWDGTAWNALGNEPPAISIAVGNGQVFLLEQIYDTIKNEYNSQVKRWDGTAWVDVGPLFAGNIYAITVSPGEIPFVAGNIRNSTGSFVKYLGQWNPINSTWEAFPEDPGLDVVKMVFQGSDLIVTGYYFNDLSSCGSFIKRWNGSQWSPVGTPSHSVDKPVASVVGPAENDLYLGGYFTCVNGVPSPAVAHWNGASLEPAGDGLSGQINQLAWANNKLYAAGRFTAKNNAAIQNVAYMESGIWKPLGNALEPGEFVSSIAVSGNKIAIAQLVSYPTSSSPAQYQVWMLQNGVWQKAGGTINGWANAVAIVGDSIYVAGYFDAIGGLSFSNIARWDGTAWNPLGSGLNDGAYTLSASGNSLLVGGAFTQAGGVPGTANIARWDGTAWSSIGGGLDFYITAIATYGSDIYAAGHVYPSNLLNSNLVRWDGNSWSRIGHGTGNPSWWGTDEIRGLVILNGSIYAGGSFTNAGGSPSNYFGWWHAPVIHGQVLDGLQGMSGVTVSSTDGHSAVTDANGNYSLTGVGMGGTFSANKAGRTFDPLSRQVSEANIALDITGQDFTMNPLQHIYLPLMIQEPVFSISGSILDQSGKPVPGIVLKTDTGVSAVSGANGLYTLQGLRPRTYTVTPQVTSWYLFNPVSRTVVLPNADLGGINFTAMPNAGDYIINGGFETGGGWEVYSTAIPAGITTRDFHSGSRSMQAGLFSGSTNVKGYSKFRQTVPIPTNAKSAQLTFWLNTSSTETANKDSQYVYVADANGYVLDYLVTDQVRNDHTWVKYQFNLIKYAGQTIRILFGVYNDGTGGMTGMLVDDVSLMITP